MAETKDKLKVYCETSFRSYLVSAHQIKNTKIPNISLDFRTEMCYTMCK